MNEILHLINQMSPYLLLGFLLAGIMHAFIPKRYFTRYLSKPDLRSVVNAALLGIPLPLCSCGVLPTAVSLRRSGASRAAATSFLIATPQTAPLREIQPDGSRHPFDQFIIAKTPAARWGNAEDLQGPAVFLASDASNFVNGHILYVDGGILAYIGKQPK